MKFVTTIATVATLMLLGNGTYMVVNPAALVRDFAGVTRPALVACGLVWGASRQTAKPIDSWVGFAL